MVNYFPGSALDLLSDRVSSLEQFNIEDIENRLGELEEDYGDLSERVGETEGNVTSLSGRCGTLETTSLDHEGRIEALEAWKAVMPKRKDRYTGTTDANGDVTIPFPVGRYTNVPHVAVSYIFNNDNYGTFYNIKALSTSSVTLRVMRNKNSAVLLGGNIDPDEPLASTAIVLLASEYA